MSNYLPSLERCFLPCGRWVLALAGITVCIHPWGTGWGNHVNPGNRFDFSIREYEWLLHQYILCKYWAKPIMVRLTATCLVSMVESR